MPEPIEIIVKPRHAPSPARSIFLALVWGCVIGIGALLGSQPMQWAGFIVWLVVGLGWSFHMVEKERRPLSIREARAKLDELEKAALR